MSQIVRDLRFAVKSLRRAPGFTFIAVLTLALGIGANTAMFGLLNALLLPPAPYPSPEMLDRIYRSTPTVSRGAVSAADYLDLRSGASGYGEVAAYASSNMGLSEPGRPAEMALGARASANLFSVLGVMPVLGRSFRAEEEILGNHRVLVLNHRFWKKNFAEDREVIGRTVRVDGEPHQIVG